MQETILLFFRYSLNDDAVVIAEEEETAASSKRLLGLFDVCEVSGEV